MELMIVERMVSLLLFERVSVDGLLVYFDGGACYSKLDSKGVESKFEPVEG